MNRLPSTDVRLLAGALVALVILAVVTVLTAPVSAPPLSVRSQEADGAMALRLWLESSGYSVREVLSDPINADGLQVLFILDPLKFYSVEEAQYLFQWVSEGHILVIAGLPFYVDTLLEPHDIAVTYRGLDPDGISEAGPTMGSPPLASVQTYAFNSIETDRADVITHLSGENGPVLVSFGAGQGTVWLSSALVPFSNRGLSDPGSARLLLNVLGQIPRGARIGFDEASHGFVENPQSLLGWLVGSAPGWGVTLALTITMVYLLLYGRRFGRVVPIPDDRLRREPVEHIVALANLLRRSGQRKAILRHYRAQLRRRLSERYALDPQLSDGELVKAVAYYDPALEPAALRDLFRRLASDHLSEQELVGATLEVDTWLRRLS